MHDIDNWLLFCQMQAWEQAKTEEIACLCARLLDDQSTQPTQEI